MFMNFKIILIFFMSNASLLHMTQVTGTEPNSFQQQSKLIELKLMSAT